MYGLTPISLRRALEALQYGHQDLEKTASSPVSDAGCKGIYMRLTDSVVVDDLLRLSLCSHDGFWVGSSRREEFTPGFVKNKVVVELFFNPTYRKLMLGNWCELFCEFSKKIYR